ncbi:hypothetical protein GGI12_001607 [Dipsacomyces acuminosporus]|nr:hypothetical protein GGI12_001607 [Dipsacomyces acuminosporus]
MPSLVSNIVAFCAVATSVLAHSWVDCVKFDPLEKSCLGYPRGYPSRKDVDINTEYTYLFSGSPARQPMCNPMQQSGMTYSDRFPMTTAQPGETLFTTWESNGHLDNARPTTIKILYYSDPSKEFKDVTERNTASVAGSMEFATDGNCYIPGDPNSVCMGKWTVPKDLVPGQVYHFVWFWYFNANPAGQWYTTCFDIKVTDKSHVCDSSKPIPELLKLKTPTIDYVWGTTSKVTAQLNNVTSLANYSGNANTNQQMPIPHAASSPSSASAAAAAPATASAPPPAPAPSNNPAPPMGDSGRNPNPFSDAPANPASSPPAAPAPTPSAPESEPIYTKPNPRKPGGVLKCRRRRRVVAL